MKRSHIVIILISAMLLIDQVVKIWIKTHWTLDYHVDVLGDWFYLRFIENPGAAFGMELGGEYGKLILSVFRIFAVGVLGWYIVRLIKRKAGMGVIVGFTMIFAGAMGNILDSAFYGLIFSESTVSSVAQVFPEGGGYAGFLHGKVVDMLYFPIWHGVFPSWLPWIGSEPFLFFSPIFNFADSYITCGVIYMMLFERKFFS